MFSYFTDVEKMKNNGYFNLNTTVLEDFWKIFNSNWRRKYEKRRLF